MPTWMKILLEVVPIFVEWIQWIIEMKDDDWEEISKSWPSPTKTRLAKLRYEAKLHAKANP